MEHTDKILVQAQNQLAVQSAIDEMASSMGMTKKQAWLVLNIISQIKRNLTDEVIQAYMKGGMDELAQVCAKTIKAQDMIQEGLEALKEDNR